MGELFSAPPAQIVGKLLSGIKKTVQNVHVIAYLVSDRADDVFVEHDVSWLGGGGVGVGWTGVVVGNIVFSNILLIFNPCLHFLTLTLSLVEKTQISCL